MSTYPTTYLEAGVIGGTRKPGLAKRALIFINLTGGVHSVHCAPAALLSRFVYSSPLDNFNIFPGQVQ
jgi:hypothetical protein